MTENQEKLLDMLSDVRAFILEHKDEFCVEREDGIKMPVLNVFDTHVSAYKLNVSENGDLITGDYKFNVTRWFEEDEDDE